MGVIRVTTLSSETGRPQYPMKPRIPASWGYPMEILGLPCGKFGVTPSTHFRQTPHVCTSFLDSFDELCVSGERRQLAFGIHQSAQAKTMESRTDQNGIRARNNEERGNY